MSCVTQVNMKLVECFSYQLFHTGFVHADPHPGNSTSCELNALKLLTDCVGISVAEICLSRLWCQEGHLAKKQQKVG